MSVEIKVILPDWCDDKHIRIFAGIELVARSMIGEDGRKPLQVKKVRCNKCGKCCMNVNIDRRDDDLGGGEKKDVFGRKSDDDGTEAKEKGWCEFLKKYGGEYYCEIDRPFGCCAASPHQEEFCSVEW